MNWQQIVIALLPVPLFYLIYYRYMPARPVLSKHLQFFLAGTAFAVGLVLVSPYLNFIALPSGAVGTGFLRAAFIEKTGAFVIMFILLRNYPGFSIMEAVFSSMMFGIGFASVENLFYAERAGLSLIVVRTFFSVPMHLTSCGIMGFFLGSWKMGGEPLSRARKALAAFVFPFVLHGAFDSILIAGGKTAYLASFLLILMVMTLEAFASRASGLVPQAMLGALGLRFEEWLAIDRQPRYERWILQSMGLPNTIPVPFFSWRPGPLRLALVIIFMGLAVAGLSVMDELTARLGLALGHGEEVVVFGIFPASLSIMLMLVGAVNPDFFRKSRISIPLISDVEVAANGEEEMMVTYDISAANCFLRTSGPLGMGERVTLAFDCGHFSSGAAGGTVVWENHADKRESAGTVVRLDEYPPRFFFFLLRYRLYRLRKGVTFLLKIPGFEYTRRLFARPISTMQEERIYRAGDIIFHEGEPGKEFYLLKSGTMVFFKTTVTGTLVMDTIGPGSIFGEMALTGTAGRAASARCETDCVVAVANKDNLEALISYNSEFASMLIATLAGRVNKSERIMVDTIKGLERCNTRLGREAFAAAFIAFAGLGYGTGGREMALSLDAAKIAGAVPGLGEGDARRILSFILEKGCEAGELDDLEGVIDRLYEDYLIRINIG